MHSPVRRPVKGYSKGEEEEHEEEQLEEVEMDSEEASPLYLYYSTAATFLKKVFSLYLFTVWVEIRYYDILIVLKDSYKIMMWHMSYGKIR